MEQYARTELAVRLDRVRKEWARAAAHPDDEAIHDLRVAIRRLSQAYRVLGVQAGEDGGKARAKLREVRQLAGEVRDCDIALDLLQKAGLPPDNPALAKVRRKRHEASGRLARLLSKGVPV